MNFLLIGAVFGFLSVAIGAFGAHALRDRLSPDMLTVFEIGVRYQMYHALALLFVALATGRAEQVRLLRVAGWCFAAGTVMFSGSLYALALSGVTTFGAITPIGGVGFLLGWGCLTVWSFQSAVVGRQSSVSVNSLQSKSTVLHQQSKVDSTVALD